MSLYTNSVTVGEHPPAPDAAAVLPARKGPVLWWALLGAFAVGSMIWAIAHWIILNFHRAPVAPGAGTSGLLTALQIVCPLVPIAVGSIVIVRPWVRDRRLSWDGVFMLACATILFQDPINNYFKFTFSYDDRLVNLSSWAPWIPGWEAGGLHNFAEPLLFIAPLCFTSFFVMSVVGCFVLDRIRARTPNSSFVTQCVLLYVFLFLWDFVFEFWMTLTGVFTFSTVYSPFSLWAGHWYQFPVYELTGVALLNLLLTLIRYTRDASGLSFVERGIGAVTLKRGPRTFVRWIALVGAVQLITFFTFFVPYNWIALKANSFPHMPARYTYGLCGSGPGATYPCPTAQDPYPGK